MSETIDLDEHIEMFRNLFQKVFNIIMKHKITGLINFRTNDKIMYLIVIRTNILIDYYSLPGEKFDWMFFEVVYRYLDREYFKKFDEKKGGLMKYIKIFTKDHLQQIINDRRRKINWEYSDGIDDNGKKIWFKGQDIYDKFRKAHLSNEHIDSVQRTNDYENTLIDVIDKRKASNG